MNKQILEKKLDSNYLVLICISLFTVNYFLESPYNTYIKIKIYF